MRGKQREIFETVCTDRIAPADAGKTVLQQLDGLYSKSITSFNQFINSSTVNTSVEGSPN